MAEPEEAGGGLVVGVFARGGQLCSVTAERRGGGALGLVTEFTAPMACPAEP